MGIRALAVKVLQGNRRGRQRETQSFLANKPRKPERHRRELKIMLPEWQAFLCEHHGKFTGTTGNCQTAYCLCDAIIDSGGDLKMLNNVEIGYGITCGQVIERCQQDGDTGQELLKDPVYFPLVARLQVLWVLLHLSLKLPLTMPSV